MKARLLAGTTFPLERGAPEPDAIDVLTACHRLGISRTKLYELLNDGTLPSFKIGRRRLVRADTLRRVLAAMEHASMEQRPAA
jgi:excisionase family DNA binding protein